MQLSLPWPATPSALLDLRQLLMSPCVQAFERMKDLGLLAGKGGLYGNVFRVKPPMCFTQADAEFTLQCFDQALSEL